MFKNVKYTEICFKETVTVEIRVTSDVHFDFMRNYPMTLEIMESILPIMEGDSERVLLLCGDMCVLNHIKPFDEFLEWVVPRFRKVLYIYGNHEYYHSHYDTVESRSDIFKEYPNFHIIKDETLVIDNIAFIGSTLWSDCNDKNPIAMNDVQRGLQDFYAITAGESKHLFTTALMVDLFDKHLKFLEEELTIAKIKGHKAIVYTHHAPSHKSVSPQYKSSAINGGFVSELFEFIMKYQPEAWFHGHLHNQSDYMIGDTRVISNPRGYPRRHDYVRIENSQYDSKLIFEV